MKMTERLYLNEARTKAVYADDRSGRHLLCKLGAELDDNIAKQYGLVDGRLSVLKNAEVVAKEIVEVVETKKERKARLKAEAEAEIDAEEKLLLAELDAEEKRLLEEAEAEAEAEAEVEANEE